MLNSRFWKGRNRLFLLVAAFPFCSTFVEDRSQKIQKKKGHESEPHKYACI